MFRKKKNADDDLHVKIKYRKLKIETQDQGAWEKFGKKNA